MSVFYKAADDGKGVLRRIRDDAVAAVGKSLEAHQIPRQRRDKILLAIYGYHRVVLAAEDERWALDAGQHREKIESTALTSRSREPKIDIGRRIPRSAASGSLLARV
jgi:hypothetical protein